MGEGKMFPLLIRRFLCLELFSSREERGWRAKFKPVMMLQQNATIKNFQRVFPETKTFNIFRALNSLRNAFKEVASSDFWLRTWRIYHESVRLVRQESEAQNYNLS